jgi:hypothetical protein
MRKITICLQVTAGLDRRRQLEGRVTIRVKSTNL